MSLYTMLESSCTGVRASVSRDSAGGLKQSFDQTLFESLACSQQEPSASVRLLYAQRNADVNAQIYFAENPLVEVNDILIVTDCNGYVTTYLVHGMSQAVGRGYGPWLVDCERIRQPQGPGFVG